jgi:hypothetical protein
MRENYIRFDDMISFNIAYNLLNDITYDNNQFCVGIFTVGDTNQRILFVGLAFVADETTTTFFTVFNTFLKIHTRSPMSIITEDQQNITLAIDQLKANKLFMGVHMFDPWHLLKNARSRL